ncbi:MAG TPA: ComF family protein [Actinomycetota bacterium]|nr:ComF family protein [Actinomycetota bacterium]
MGLLADLVSPVRCAACGTICDADLCAPCAVLLEPVTDPMCRRCGAPGGDGRAASCRQCRGLSGFRRARSLLSYSGPATRLTLALKHHGRGDLASVAGELLGDLAVRHGMGAGTTIAWVPAGSSAAVRGFDHAELLARAVARRLGVPCRHVLVRAAQGRRQAEVAMSARRDNVRGRFRAKPVSGEVLVVDDVFTTGATAEACAQALTAAGATAVDVLTFARTLRRLPARA